MPCAVRDGVKTSTGPTGDVEHDDADDHWLTLSKLRKRGRSTREKRKADSRGAQDAGRNGVRW